MASLTGNCLAFLRMVGSSAPDPGVDLATMRMGVLEWVKFALLSLMQVLTLVEEGIFNVT